MTEDSFIREVNEEIRQERLVVFWRRYGPFLIGAAIAVVLVTITFQAYSSWLNRQSARMGQDFLEAVEMADNGLYDTALIKLDEIRNSSSSAYSALAGMRRASVLLQQGDKAAAVAAFDEIALNSAMPKILRDMASIRSAYILVDTGSLADIEKRVRIFATDIDPLRLAAREALGLASWKAGQTESAMYYFQKNREDKNAANTGFYQRADMMLNLVKSQKTGTEG